MRYPMRSFLTEGKLRYLACALVYMVGLTITIYLVESRQTFWAGAVLFLTFLVLFVPSSKIKPRTNTVPYTPSALALISSLFAAVYLIEKSYPYWAGSILFIAVIGVFKLSDEISKKRNSIPYTSAALMSVTGMAISTVLIFQGHPYWAGGVLVIAFMESTRLPNIWAYETTTLPYFAFALIFISSLVDSAYLIQQDHPYWAGAILILVLSLVGNGFLYFKKDKGTFYPAGILILLGILPISIYLHNQDHSYWAGAFILATLLLLLAGFGWQLSERK